NCPRRRISQTKASQLLKPIHSWTHTTKPRLNSPALELLGLVWGLWALSQAGVEDKDSHNANQQHRSARFHGNRCPKGGGMAARIGCRGGQEQARGRSVN
ncbi:hypothetical protein EMPG_16106, partial [Blastomyces silverae]